MSRLTRIGLGTVQLGADYGVSNHQGRPDEAEVAAILACAVEAGLGYLDTAAGYGEAETLIGRHLPDDHDVRIVTKLPPVAEDLVTRRHADAALEALARSLARLDRNAVHGLLLHSARDLAKPGWQHLRDALDEARGRGWAARTGVSVYDADDLALSCERLVPGIVQLPLSTLDRRLVACGWLDRLTAAGVEVHARSIFLQGLLLMDPTALPDFFAPLQPTLARLHAGWAARTTPLAGCLDYVLRNEQVDAVIVGVNRLRELKEIVAAVADLDDTIDDSAPVAVDPTFLDPRRWPPLNR